MQGKCLRRAFYALALCLLCPAASHAGTISVLISDDLPVYGEVVDGIVSLSGQNIALRKLDGRVDDTQHAIRKLLEQKPDLIIAVGPQAARTILAGEVGIPVIVLMVSRPERLIQGRDNACAISLSPPPEKQVEMLLQLLPNTRRIGFIAGEASPSKETTDIARLKVERLQQVAATVKRADDLAVSADTLLASVDVFWLTVEDVASSPESISYLLRKALDHNVPVIGFSPYTVKKGALFSAVTSYRDMGRQGAAMALEILGGRSPAEGKAQCLRYAEPTGYIFNNAIAKHYGIVISPGILSKAVKVYE